MKIKVINNNITADEILQKAGSYANICYSSKTYGEFCDSTANPRIAKMCIENGHHSIFDHINITFSLEEIPKEIVLMLNNIGFYNTSEKSGRYTRFSIDEYPLYKKWITLFEEIILNTENIKPHIKEDLKLVNKLAMENARYFLPIDFPTNLIYTTSIRNLSYLYNALEKISDIYYILDKKLTISPSTRDSIKEFRNLLSDTLPFIEELKIFPKDGNNNILNKINIFKPTMRTQISANVINTGDESTDTYVAKYICSYACVAQLQRHRTTKLDIRGYKYIPTLDGNKMQPITKSYDKEYYDFYIPEILKEEENKEYLEAYISDMKSINCRVMGSLVYVTEIGTIADFKLKAIERLCSRPQLEITNLTKDLIERLDILDFNKKDKVVAKCGNFKCLEPCKYGIHGLNRII